jgi:DNA-binding transcriptional ArsR family regulator
MPMHGEADLAAVGGLIADRTRATILLTLLGGGLTSASALAGRAEVSPSLASNHLRKPSEGGLAVVERRGRQRMYRLASTSIAMIDQGWLPGTDDDYRVTEDGIVGLAQVGSDVHLLASRSRPLTRSRLD